MDLGVNISLKSLGVTPLINTFSSLKTLIISFKSMWHIALIFVNRTVFAMRLICIERGQFQFVGLLTQFGRSNFEKSVCTVGLHFHLCSNIQDLLAGMCPRTYCIYENISPDVKHLVKLSESDAECPIQLNRIPRPSRALGAAFVPVKPVFSFLIVFIGP